MKRYSPYFNYELDKFAMDEDPDGEYYSRADLIAAGVLVPVLDGEALDVDALPENCLMVMFNNNIYHRKPKDYWWPCFVGNCKPPALQSMTIVQPVRLVPLEDVG